VNLVKGIPKTARMKRIIACRRKQPSIIERPQNITCMQAAVTVKRPSIMTVGSTKKPPIRLTRQRATPFKRESTLKGARETHTEEHGKN
jgi:hypothetical protein